MKAGKIIYFVDTTKAILNKINALDSEVKGKLKAYNREFNNFENISKKVFEENKTNINDFKTIFNSMYNGDFKSVKDTFENGDRIFYNKGFKLDEEKQMLMFEEEDKTEVEFDYYRQNGNSIVFFFKNQVELNTLKIISKDENGFNIVPTEIIIENSFGKTFFLEDFSRFFAENMTLDVQTYISNLKSVNSIEFVYDAVPNYVISTYKFFKTSYKSENEVILKYKNIFKENNIIKLRRNVYDKNKFIKYSISFDNAVTFKDFDWTNPELDGLGSEDDVKLINIPDDSTGDIFIKLLSVKDEKVISNQKVVATKDYNKNMISEDDAEDNGYEYVLDNYGGVINKNSIKIYFSNKNGNLIKEYNSEIIDTFSEAGKIVLAAGFLNVEKTYLDDDDIYYLCDFDDLDSLSNIKNELCFFKGDSLFFPTLFFSEGINFRVKYSVDFYESDSEVEFNSPFIFDLDVIGGDS